ncbi:MAG: NAD(P)H-hydrate dehydratase [Halobacteriaceae archaeon]
MITAQEVAVLDRNAAALGIDPRVLMEASGRAVANTVEAIAGADAEILIVAGRGNNGGDGFAAARYLEEHPLRVCLLGRPESITTPEARTTYETLLDSEIPVETVTDTTDFDLGRPDVVVDAMLGTGVTGALREPERTVATRINDGTATVVAVDTPSGIDVDTGTAAGIAVNADRVVTFHDMKPGLADRDDVTVADIGIPTAAERFVGPGDRLRLSRDPTAHKGDFGRVLLVGGGPYTGAPALTAQAALRGGADLATVYTPDPAADAVAGYSENLIVRRLEGPHLTPEHVPTLADAATDQDVLLVGPGLGDADAPQTAVADLLAGYEGTAVVDADALQVVPDVDTAATLICTPHQGELAEMGGPQESAWTDRAPAVEDYAATLDHVLLVKGAYDVISNGTTTRINRTGNPGMTVGGTGDVLAGVTAALAATLDPVDAAALAAWANGRAGDDAVEASGYGLVATDLLSRLPEALWGEDDV